MTHREVQQLDKRRPLTSSCCGLMIVHRKIGRGQVKKEGNMGKKQEKKQGKKEGRKQGRKGR